MNTVNPTLTEEVKEYLQHLLDRATKDRQWRIEASKRNESYYYGKQTLAIGKDGALHDDWNRHYRPVTYNYIRQIVNIVAARLTKDRPSASAYPGSEEEVDRISAEIARQYMEHHELAVGADDLIHSVAFWGVMHGTSGMKIVWDVDAERMLWEPLDVHQFLLDPSAKRGASDAKWIAFMDYRADEWDVREFFPGEVPDLNTTKYSKTVDGKEDEGILCVELWHVPTWRVPTGLYVKMIGGHIVESSEYPEAYIFKEGAVLPFAQFRCLEHRGTAMGDTWLDDCIDVQSHINRNQSGLQFLEEMTTNIKLALPPGVIEKWNEHSQTIDSTAFKEDQAFWLPQPHIPQLAIANREQLVQDLFNLAGVNQMTAGRETPKASASARQVAYVYELDSEKHSGSFKSLQRMIERVWYITLNVSQKMFTTAHWMKLAGRGAMDVAVYLQADLAGVDVRVEPRAGQERWSAQKGVQATEDYQMGLLPPEDALEYRTTGQPSSYRTSNEKMVVSEIEGVLQGAGASLEADPSIAIPVIQKYISLLLEQNSEPHYVLVLKQLLSLYQSRSDNNVAQS